MAKPKTTKGRKQPRKIRDLAVKSAAGGVKGGSITLNYSKIAMDYNSR